MKSMSSVKYPRTPHLPFSPGFAYDDERLVDLDALKGKEIVCTEKMDGENTTLYRDHWHARSINSIRKHESRDWMAAYWATVCDKIPSGHRVCGENMYAQHSIAYKNLDAYFLVHSVWRENICMNYQDTIKFCGVHGFQMVPEIYRGPFSFEALTLVAAKLDLSCQEGFIVRTTEMISMEVFHRFVAKWVRPHHVQEEQKHWFSSKVIKNSLRK